MWSTLKCSSVHYIVFESVRTLAARTGVLQRTLDTLNSTLECTRVLFSLRESAYTCSARDQFEYPRTQNTYKYVLQITTRKFTLILEEGT